MLTYIQKTKFFSLLQNKFVLVHDMKL